MPTSTSNFVTKFPFPISQTCILPDQLKSSPVFAYKNSRQIPTQSPVSSSLTSKSNQMNCSAAAAIPMMEEQPDKLELEDSDSGIYSKELEVAVKAVHMASLLCKEVQERLIHRTHDGSEGVHSKHDTSPVTIADWSVQAVVSWILSETFGGENVSIVAEEDVEELSKIGSTDLLNNVVKTVNECLAKAPLFGLEKPSRPLDTDEVLNAIHKCNSVGGETGKFWVLDPVDGTLGFVRGDQYAIALSLIEDGEPVLGVLGCPNYPVKKEWLSYQNGYRRILSRLTSPTMETLAEGCVMYAKRGSGKAWMHTLFQGDKKIIWPNFGRQIKVSSIDNPAMATFCEPVEKANSSHSFTAGLAHSVGMRCIKFSTSLTTL
ncbi:OLC1v1021670C1 [Oldenlandia corymbosa var. corymbosa]|uniref:3'(2'),5'-bisphosphate nucleotidase n=1 Tax=Oldenlandia corymbosa var. corymbosa TaxID=529605 RepID=A0AAV1BYS7_OLDCO|nr:OLC1v1021670C1 [Oldenlandia corymbosa var. corymbosa]